MVQAAASGAGDCGSESHLGHAWSAAQILWQLLKKIKTT